MSGSRFFAVGALLTAAWFGRGLLTPGVESDEEPFAPIARYVELEPADLEWEPNAAVRDPFAPLVLPSIPVTDAASTPGE